MSAKLDKLRRLLAELFQLDQADLDFGIYRIMNAKRGRSPVSWKPTCCLKSRKFSRPTAARIELL